MATLGSLIISLEANTAKFESAMTKAQYAAKKSSDAIKGAFLGLGAALGAAFSVKEIISAVEGVAKYEGQLLKTAGKLNTTVEILSSFGVMMRKTGMDADAFYTTLTRLEKGISAAALKADEGKEIIDEEGNIVLKTSKAYDELGLKAEALLKLPLDQQLMAIAEAFKNNIAPADRVRVAMEIGGKTAAGLVNIFKGGAEDIDRWIKQQQNLGIVTEEAAKKSAQFNSAIADFTAQWEALKRELAEGVIPTLIALLQAINNVIKAWKEFRESHVGQYAPVQVEQMKKTMPIVKRIAPEQAIGIPQMGPMGPEIPPVPPVPPDVFKTPVRTGTKVGGGGGGGKGGGGGDAGLERMQSIIDTLQKDLSRLTEGSLSEIKAWAAKMGDEIAKVGRKGADTATAMALKDQVEKAKMKKATEDYELFVAKESGDAYKQIEADARNWLTTYKGFADAEKNLQTIKNRKIAEEDNKQQSDRLSLQKGFLDSISSEMPLLSQQLELRKKLLPIEMELRRLELDRQIGAMPKLTKDQKDELRRWQALENQVKKTSLERAKWATQGTAGGLKIASADMKRQAETWAAEQTAALVKQMPDQISSLIASSLVGFLQGKAPDLEQLGISMAESMLKTLLEGIMNQIIPQMVSALADALSSIVGSIGGGGGGFGDIFGSIFGGLFHGGGMITAHGGWPLRSDERLIRAQTGERVLSREQNRAYEAGMSGAPITMVNNFRYQMTQAEWDRAIKLQIIPGIKKASANRGGGLS